MTERDTPSAEDVELAESLLEAWDEGRGTSKSQLEIETWGDATAHGRHFDRFIRTTLGVSTTKPSRQTTRIEALEQQVRTLGQFPTGIEPTHHEIQAQHARSSCGEAIRVWNDPSTRFRTGAFSLLFVTAWNSLALGLLIKGGIEWHMTDRSGNPKVDSNGLLFSRDTMDLVGDAFPGDDHKGLRRNVKYWIDIRNAVAHRHLPALDALVIPKAQAGLLNFEDALVNGFGHEFALADSLTVPLQLSGFRDPTVLASRKKMQAQLPLDVQALLARSTKTTQN